jgi:hypothetical protein
MDRAVGDRSNHLVPDRGARHAAAYAIGGLPLILHFGGPRPHAGAGAAGRIMNW